jgi:uncharacterized protein
MIKKTDENISIPMVVDVPYKFAAGRYMTRALTELRDNGKLFAIKCPKCGRFQIPARIVCAECHVVNEEWVDLPMEGTLQICTINYLPMTDPTTGQVKEPPSVYGTILLDGVPIGLGGNLNVEPDTSKLWTGMRLRVVLRPDGQRIGDLSDIQYFEPLPGQVKPGTKA